LFYADLPDQMAAKLAPNLPTFQQQQFFVLLGSKPPRTHPLIGKKRPMAYKRFSLYKHPKSESTKGNSRFFTTLFTKFEY
jgi:hypothetical protein